MLLQVSVCVCGIASTNFVYSSQSLLKLRHPNIVKLHELLRDDGRLYFVFEYMKENLYEMLKHRTKLYPEPTVRNILYQILQGLAFMHKQGGYYKCVYSGISLT